MSAGILVRGYYYDRPGFYPMAQRLHGGSVYHGIHFRVDYL